MDINKEYYHKYSSETLYQEYIRRGIHIPSAMPPKKAILIKKLKQHNRVLDYEDNTA